VQEKVSVGETVAKSAGGNGCPMQPELRRSFYGSLFKSRLTVKCQLSPAYMRYIVCFSTHETSVAYLRQQSRSGKHRLPCSCQTQQIKVISSREVLAPQIEPAFAESGFNPDNFGKRVGHSQRILLKNRPLES